MRLRLVELPMTTPRLATALVYDFDGTLARGNVQEHSFLPELGIDKDDFWPTIGALAKEHDADQVLIYMWRLLHEARERGMPITRRAFEKHGRTTPLFDGVESWFDRIEAHGRTHGLELEHYIVSSGTHEMISGCRISSRFKRIHASRFLYNEAGEAIWPAVAINYTNKTQFLFRINKGIETTWDDTRINRYIPDTKRAIPFSRMVFLGDGETDIPSMKMVRMQGGHSIAVFDPDKWSEPNTQEHVHRLITDNRTDFTVPADYREGSQLDIAVKGVLGRIARAADVY